MLARCSFFCVGVDAHIDPREVANSLEISVKSGYFAGTMWASSPTRVWKITDEQKRPPSGGLSASGEKIFSIRATNAQSCRLLRQRDK